MKKLLTMLLTVMLFCSMGVSIMAASVGVSIDKSAVNAGDTVTVTVKMDETLTGNFRNVQGQLNYDTSAWTYISHTMGESYSSYRSSDMPNKSYFTFTNTDFSKEGFKEVPQGTIVAVVFKANSDFSEKHLSEVFTLNISVQDVNGQSEDFGSSASVLICKEHTWGEWEVTKEATETEAGEKVRECSVCGEKETEEIPALGTPDPTPTPTPSNPFEDVKENDWFYKAVLWGAENKVVAGLTETKFGPAAVCTRAQIVAFLWRAADRPEPQSTECPFTDVAESEFYYKAMLWAVENNIAKGYAEDKFAPDATCTRAEMATFLWRVDGRKPVEGESPFSDVTNADYFYTPAIWASQNKIVSGYEDGTFAPYNTIARAETVTMLYRYNK